MQDTYISRFGKAQQLKGFLLVLAALLIGFFYYAIYRQHAHLSFISGWADIRYSVTSLLPLGYKVLWLPSFLHAFATMLLLHCLLARSSALFYIGYRVAVVVFLLGVELLLGQVDPLDMLAVVAGVALAEVVAVQLRLVSYRQLAWSKLQSVRSPVFNSRCLLLVASASALLAAGSTGGGAYTDCATYDGVYCVEYKRPGVPVYMSYQRLRDAVQIEAARPPDRLGRVYLYQDYLFLNEVNEGIHVIDNSDPTAPVNLGFIRVPGNTDIAIRDNFLYADSYIDLITLDLNDPSSIVIVSRQEDIFPYDAFQNIPYNVDLSSFDIDPQLGVIISYQLSGS